MKREFLLTEKILQIQQDLNRWATEMGVIEEGERLVVVVRTQKDDDICRMSPEDFFSLSRLMGVGLTHSLAVRVCNCVNSVNHRGIFRDGAYQGQEVIYKTMVDFLTAFSDVSHLHRIKNLGDKTVAGMVKLIRDAGMTIEDRRNLLK